LPKAHDDSEYITMLCPFTTGTAASETVMPADLYEKIANGVGLGPVSGTIPTDPVITAVVAPAVKTL
jgi:hypothetical protein